MAIMNVLVDIHARCATNEQFIEDLRAKKMTEEESRLQNLFLTHANDGTNRGATRRVVMTGPRHDDHETIHDIANKVWVRVASHLRGAPALDVPNTDVYSGSKEEATTPAPRTKGLKSGKIHTGYTTVLLKITWPHEMVYTSAGQPTVYEKMSVTLFVSGFQTVMAGRKITSSPNALALARVDGEQ